MFPTSDWGSDVPKGDLRFEKKAVNGKNSKKLTSKLKNCVIDNNKRHVAKGFPEKINQKQSAHLLNKNPTKIGPKVVKQAANSPEKKSRNEFNKPTALLSINMTSNETTVNKSVGQEVHKHNIAKNLNKKRSNGLNKNKPIPEINASPNHTANDKIRTNKQLKKKKKGKKVLNLNVKDNIPLETNSGELSLSGDNLRKRKLNTKKAKTSLESSIISLEIAKFDSDKPDEAIIDKKRKLLNDDFKKNDREEILFKEISKPVNAKKERLKKVLNAGLQRTPIKSSSNSLRTRMLERLKAAQFRYLNEKLYTSSGSEAQQLFQNDPDAFQTYHEGYQQQLKKWPVNPLDIIVKTIQKMPKSSLIADMGCGEAKLAKRVQQTVRSFDLVSLAPGVETCDMAHTPLLTASVDAVVYCLALMGTDLTKYLVEANRVLKIGGLLLIAEVESRFDDPEAFAKEVQRLGFKLQKLDKSQTVFFFMEFRKMTDPPAKKNKLPALTLKPCLYKRR